jgi:hypothetical protein
VLLSGVAADDSRSTRAALPRSGRTAVRPSHPATNAVVDKPVEESDGKEAKSEPSVKPWAKPRQKKSGNIVRLCLVVVVS